MDSLSENRQAGATTEIEITPAMVEAGSAFYRRHLLESDPCDGGAELVADVFLAMCAARESGNRFDAISRPFCPTCYGVGVI